MRISPSRPLMVSKICKKYEKVTDEDLEYMQVVAKQPELVVLAPLAEGPGSHSAGAGSSERLEARQLSKV